MKLRPLKPWVIGNGSVTPSNFFNNSYPSIEMGAFISIDVAIDLHLADSVETGNLHDSWNANKEYIEKACKIANVGFDNNFDLDNEEKMWILNELGEPPESSYNLYFITIYNEMDENLVYIGKTDSKKSRFTNGHMAALKLHNPKFKDYGKRVYFGTIFFLTREKDYLPIEFINSCEDAQKYLSEMEALLINHFKPELNKRIEACTIFETLGIHIQNFSGKSEFLNDYFLFGI